MDGAGPYIAFHIFCCISMLVSMGRGCVCVCAESSVNCALCELTISERTGISTLPIGHSVASPVKFPSRLCFSLLNGFLIS